LKSSDSNPLRPAELLAPDAWVQIDFLSDLHLAPQTPATLAALQHHLLNTPAQAVFLLGDIFEVWIGDDTRFEPFEAQCTALLAAASRRLDLFFMAGNRDFLVGERMLKACGTQALSDPTVLIAFGQRWLISHGDALCLADLPYQAFRSQVRSKAWQDQFLAQPLEVRRALARQMREASQASQAQSSDWIDLDTSACEQLLEQTGCHALIHGHTHRPAVHVLALGLQRHVLSDWDFDGSSPRGDVLRLSGNGLLRLHPA
jgi:UDP-2,3-diacylglucosamine hydrolase